MTCREFIEFLWRYIDEVLLPEEREEFEEHLAKCPHCVKYLQSYRQTAQLGKAAVTNLEDVVPGEVPEELITAILAAQRKTA